MKSFLKGKASAALLGAAVGIAAIEQFVPSILSFINIMLDVVLVCLVWLNGKISRL